MLVLRYKKCSKCGKSLPVGAFYDRPETSDRLFAFCKYCKSEHARKRRLNHLLRCGPGSPSSLLASARRNKRGIPCLLTKEWVEERVIRGVCEITGIPFVRGEYRSPFAPSIDRVDPNGGYTPENCQVILWGLNAAKGVATQEEFINFLQMVSYAVAQGNLPFASAPSR